MLADKKKIKASAEHAIQQSVFPGCVVGIVSKEEKTVLSYGRHTYDPDGRNVAEDSVYDLASVTKSIPVASIVGQLIVNGTLRTHDLVRVYAPELRNDHGATIEDLLRYRVQGPRMSHLRYATFEEIRTHIFEHGFSGPSRHIEYSNVPAYVLGVIIEKISGRTLPALSHDMFFGPLGMDNTTFFPHSSDCVPTETDEEGIPIQGIVHDESARIFARARRAVGHAGLFSTAPDLLEFLEALLRNRFPAIVDGAEQGLGWSVNEPRFMGHNCTEHRFGKTGFTGTSVVIDRAQGTALVILSNRTYPKRPPDQNAINAFRSEIADIVFG